VPTSGASAASEEANSGVARLERPRDGIGRTQSHSSWVARSAPAGTSSVGCFAISSAGAKTESTRDSASLARTPFLVAGHSSPAASPKTVAASCATARNKRELYESHRPGAVNLGFVAESSKASRSRLITAFRLCSISANVSSGQNARCRSSRVIGVPACRTLGESRQARRNAGISPGVSCDSAGS
jgi:hypothetical protein